MRRMQKLRANLDSDRIKSGKTLEIASADLDVEYDDSANVYILYIPLTYDFVTNGTGYVTFSLDDLYENIAHNFPEQSNNTHTVKVVPYLNKCYGNESINFNLILEIAGNVTDPQTFEEVISGFQMCEINSERSLQHKPAFSNALIGVGRFYMESYPDEQGQDNDLSFINVLSNVTCGAFEFADSLLNPVLQSTIYLDSNIFDRFTYIDFDMSRRGGVQLYDIDGSY